MAERDGMAAGAYGSGAAHDLEGDMYVNLPLAAHLTGLGERRLRDMIARGEIEALTAGTATLIPLSSLRPHLPRRRPGDRG